MTAKKRERKREISYSGNHGEGLLKKEREKMSQVTETQYDSIKKRKQKKKKKKIFKLHLRTVEKHLQNKREHGDKGGKRRTRDRIEGPSLPPGGGVTAPRAPCPRLEKGNS